MWYRYRCVQSTTSTTINAVRGVPVSDSRVPGTRVPGAGTSNTSKCTYDTMIPGTSYQIMVEAATLRG